MPEPKILVVGLDGATLDLIEPWAQQGLLPSFARLMKEGSFARLQSVMPVLSSAAWSSFMTGMNPGKHSLYDFVRREPGSYRLRPVRREHLQAPSLWRLLSRYGRRVGVMNVPMTYPPEEVNGFLVSGLGTPDYKPFTYPEELGDELRQRGYRVNKQAVYHPEAEEKYLADVYDLAEVQFQAALWLVQTRPWDFFMTVFFDTDQMAHYFWRHMDTSHPAHPAGTHLADALRNFYQKMDAYIGRLVEAAGPDTTVLVISDHGAGPFYQDVYLNEWLRAEGYLSIETPVAQLKGAHRWFGLLGLTRENVSKSLRQAGLGRLERWIKDRIGDRIEVLPKSRRAEFPQAVDWSRTRAYSFGYQGQVYVNLKGREPQGIVEPGEAYETLLAELADRLKTIQEPRDGWPVVDQVFRKEELFHGPHTDLAPDLTLVMRNLSYITRQGYEFSPEVGKIFSAPAWHLSGSHRQEGILFAAGPGIRAAGYQAHSPDLIDLAPTLLHLLGCPVPAEMDGQVLKEWLVGERAVEIDHAAQAMSSGGTGWSEGEEQEIVERLKSLGYLE